MNTIKIALQIPFKVLLKRIIKRLIPSPKTNYSKLELRQTSSNFKLNTLLTAHQLNSTFRDDIVNHYLNQEFNLLGSGWVNRNLKKEVEQADQHCVFTNQLRQTLPKDYPLIDWQLDVRSGFRFDIKKQFDAQEIPQNKNVDIKNCWELGRLQHFPQMALAAVNQSNKIAIITAFKHQSLDFILLQMMMQKVCLLLRI